MTLFAPTLPHVLAIWLDRESKRRQTSRLAQIGTYRRLSKKLAHLLVDARPGTSPKVHCPGCSDPNCPGWGNEEER